MALNRVEYVTTCVFVIEADRGVAILVTGREIEKKTGVGLEGCETEFRVFLERC